ncbi:MAG: nitroreductase family protein [Chitinivibrionales bacterium]|nr:nitroreductase family protein [Chitinivibrionales bacterium]MBD3396745.1 nitroreductase family protein [Chitinivibrionales bacterium]
MNPGIELILGRRSIRRYKKEKVAGRDVQALLESAMAAPSARQKDPWRFVVVGQADVLNTIAEGLPNGKMLAEAPLGLVVCGDLAAANSGVLSYMLQDCTAAIENILIAVHALGLGACWLGVHPREDRMAHLTKVLGLPEGVIPVCVIAVGHPDEEKEPRTRYNPELVHHERW